MIRQLHRVAGFAFIALSIGALSVSQAPSASAAVYPCTDGGAPVVLDSVACSVPGNYTLTVPAGTTTVDVDVVGAGGGAGRVGSGHTGGDAGEVTGTATLPTGTAFLYVIVGAPGAGDAAPPSSGARTGGGASAIIAQDSSHGMLAKLVVAGGGGGGADNGDGGDAGSAGTSDRTAATPGQPGVGATGGAAGTATIFTYSAATAGASDVPTTQTVASGGVGGRAVLVGQYGGSGGGGYGGGGGGGGNAQLFTGTLAGGGGGSSFASSALAAPVVSVKSGTGGVASAAAGSGAPGTVTMVFNGLGVPGAPTAVSATPGDGQASVAFTPPVDDGGSAITSYTVTSSPGGLTVTCAASPCVVTGLTNGTVYTFTVHATNTIGDSAESVASTAITPVSVPGAPIAVSAIVGDGQASVSFSAPTDDGGSAITSYTVTSSPGGLTVTCAASPCVVTGLTNGTAYTFTVHATNTIGDSPESSPSTAVTPLGVPGEPTAVSATPGDGQASVAFTPPVDDGGSAITSYTVTSSPGGLTVTCAASPCVVTGLTNGTVYTFTVHATNTIGDSAESVASTAITPVSVPGAPIAVSAIVGDGQASVAFTPPVDDGGSAITSYTVTSSPGGLTVTCAASPCVVTGLTNGTAYTFTVHATNTIGDSPESSPSTAVTPLGVPGAPTAVSATPGDGQASVAFTPPVDDGGSAIIRYEITTDGGTTWSTLTTTDTNGTRSGSITGLTNGTTYSVQVRAVNAVGTGAASIPASVTPTPIVVPGAPTAVSATPGDGQASVSFSAPTDDGGSAITSYTVTSSPGGLTVTCAASPCVVTGLTNGTVYTFTVHATNTIGDSPESVASTPVTPHALPAAPGRTEPILGFLPSTGASATLLLLVALLLTGTGTGLLHLRRRGSGREVGDQRTSRSATV